MCVCVFVLIEAMSQLIAEDKSGAKAKGVLQCYPQLVPAFRCIQERLGMQGSGAPAPVPAPGGPGLY